MALRRWIAGLLTPLAAVSLWAVEVPRKSPDLQIHMLNGTSIQVSQYAGKIVAIVFLKPS